jgi:hypothetical protein
MARRIDIPGPGAVSPDGQFLFTSTLVFYDVQSGRFGQTLVPLSDELCLSVGPQGHYIGPRDAESQLVYVVQSGGDTKVLSPGDFERAYGWRNDPQRVVDDPEVYRHLVVSEAMAAVAAAMALEPRLTDGRVVGAARLPLRNRLDEPLRFRIAWKLPPGSPWSVQPPGYDQTMAPDQAQVATFLLRCNRGAGEPLHPAPVAHVQILAVDGTVLQDREAAVALEVKPFMLQHRPSMRCTPRAASPRVDGHLDDDAWQRPPDAPGFLLRRLEGWGSTTTQVWTACDAQHLYFAFRCAEPNLPGLVLKARNRDDPAWQDDSVELLLQPDPGTSHHFFIAVTAGGVVLDRDAQDDWGWTSSGRFAAGREAGGWTLEAAIPWSELGLAGPPAGSTWGLQLARNRIQAAGEVSQWSPTMRLNAEVEHFGRLEF